MKKIILSLLLSGNIFAQTTVCESGQVDLILKKDSRSECYNNKMERKLKYRFCESGQGFLYEENYPTKQFFSYKGQWHYRTDTIDYTNKKETMNKWVINKELSDFTFMYHEKTFSGEFIKSYTCEGIFKKQ